jgi:hypothetical protein
MNHQSGASVNARNKIPSTDLASLVTFLVKAFPAKGSEAPLDWPVLQFDPVKKRLTINVYGVMHRFITEKDMWNAFRYTDSTGFMRDMEIPSKGFTARMGGRVFEDNGSRLSQGVIKLKRLIKESFEQFGIVPDNILIPDSVAALEKLANITQIKDFLKESPVQMMSMEFAKSDRSAVVREKDVARIISAIEEIQAEDWLKRMSDSIIETQTSQDDEFDEIHGDMLVETLKQDAEKHDSQITRFLNFLEDEALSRVRLKVSFAIMESLAVQVEKNDKTNAQDFAHYVQRVSQLFDCFGAPESSHSLQINLSGAYKLDADFSIAQQLVKSTFYNCLPVWSESNTQIFESHSTDTLSRGVSIIREVSYRFRVNGKNPQHDMQHSFDARLTRLHKELIDSPASELSAYRLRKNLSEVVFLWLALNPAIAPSDVVHEAKQLTDRLSEQGRAGILQLLSELKAWSPLVRKLSTTLIDLLRKDSRNVISRAQKSIDDLFLVVQQSVVDWSAIERTRGKSRDPLVKAADGHPENIEWFKHIKITRKPDEVLESLFSIQVKTRLNERTLSMREGENSALQSARQLPEDLLNITWIPMQVDRKKIPVNTEHRAKINPAWFMGAGVDISYDADQLNYRDNKSQYTDEDKRQFRVATATAMTIVIYVVLQVLAERLIKQSGRPLSALMLRFQSQGKEAHKNDGNHFVYAMAHAIESALMRDMSVRMQGLVASDNRIYKDKGAAFALSAAFPLVMSSTHKSSVDKIAVVIYATRPCDAYPGAGAVAGFIFQAKTYLAEAVSDPVDGYRLSFDRMQTHVVETHDAFESPKLIVEEVSRLQGMGYEHILLISNHFGNPRINRSAQRHSPHTQTAFLDAVAAKFANLNLYMLRRDVFPATRLHTRGRKESAFEVSRIADHDEFAITHSSGISKALIPIYTFATLAVVGDEASRPQSGFCTYFLDEDHRVKNLEWRERVRANILMPGTGTRACLLAVLRGLHFLEAEKQIDAGMFKPVLDPFSWIKPNSTGGSGEIEALPSSRRKGNVLLSLPAMLSHITDALHSGRD